MEGCNYIPELTKCLKDLSKEEKKIKRPIPDKPKGAYYAAEGDANSSYSVKSEEES